MPVARGRRVLLLSTAFAIAAGSAGAAAFGDDQDHHAASPPPDSPALRAAHWEWTFPSADGDVISVRARRCPKHHPHKVGSFHYTATKIVNDQVQTHTANGSFCAK
jgi:hypothetical protein